MAEHSTPEIEIQAEPEATTIAAIVEQMRAMIGERRDLWPHMEIRYGVPRTTLQGFAANYELYRNPTLRTLELYENLCRMIQPDFLGARPEIDLDDDSEL